VLGCGHLDRDLRAVVLAPSAPHAPAPMAASEGSIGRVYRSGALQSVGKKKVRRSFSSLFKFSWGSCETVEAAAGGAVAALKQGAMHLALVLQNSPSAAKSLVAAGNGQGELSAGGGFDGISACPNSLGVVVDMDRLGATLSVRLCPRPTAAVPSPQAETLASVLLPRLPLPDSGHWLLVEVGSPPSFGATAIDSFHHEFLCVCFFFFSKLRSVRRLRPCRSVHEGFPRRPPQARAPCLATPCCAPQGGCS
jgi:hypothetical protein